MTAATTQSAPRALTHNQQHLVDEYVATYNIAPEDIGFEGNTETPFFYYDALAAISYQLLDYESLIVTPSRVDTEQGYAMSEATLTRHGRTVSNFATCFIGQDFGDGRQADDLTTAVNASRTLALRAVLRMVGFDPVRAHRAFTANEQIELEQATDPRTRELRHIHALATELDWISGKDDTEYRRQIGIYFDGLSSAGDMTDRQRAQFIAIMNGLHKARKHNG